jgi:hypothetical protein
MVSTGMIRHIVGDDIVEMVPDIEAPEDESDIDVPVEAGDVQGWDEEEQSEQIQFIQKSKRKSKQNGGCRTKKSTKPPLPRTDHRLDSTSDGTTRPKGRKKCGIIQRQPSEKDKNETLSLGIEISVEASGSNIVPRGGPTTVKITPLVTPRN